MSSAFERHAAERVLELAYAAGVMVPDDLARAVAMCGTGSYAARTWAREHPDDALRGCCDGEIQDPELCVCWVPEYDLEQAPARPPAGPGDLEIAAAMCGDCAFRPDSPERADDWTAEALMELPATGRPFYCHTGIRRPARWRHPDGRVVDGAPDDYQPLIVASLPYRADGQPALLCAGWAAIAAHARKEA